MCVRACACARTCMRERESDTDRQSDRETERQRDKTKLAQGFNTAAQDLNPGSRSKSLKLYH